MEVSEMSEVKRRYFRVSFEPVIPPVVDVYVETDRTDADITDLVYITPELGEEMFGEEMWCNLRVGDVEEIPASEIGNRPPHYQAIVDDSPDEDDDEDIDTPQIRVFEPSDA
jgi:hypothetical protein